MYTLHKLTSQGMAMHYFMHSQQHLVLSSMPAHIVHEVHAHHSDCSISPSFMTSELDIYLWLHLLTGKRAPCGAWPDIILMQAIASLMLTLCLAYNIILWY